MALIPAKKGGIKIYLVRRSPAGFSMADLQGMKLATDHL